MMKTQPVPLVKEFQDLSLQCSMSFTNEHYQYRSSNPTRSNCMCIRKLSDKYLLKCVWDYRHQYAIKEFPVTGEWNLEFSIFASTQKITSILGSSVVIEKDNLRNFILTNSFNKKDVDSLPIFMETEVYLNMDNDDLYPMKITFKKNRGGLIPMFTEIELPCDLCDKWYELFAKHHYQSHYGPQLI